MIKAIIKGTRSDAERAAIAHQCTIYDVMAETAHNEVVALIEDEYERNVYGWFNDAPYSPPYPTGTLLWFRSK